MCVRSGGRLLTLFRSTSCDTVRNTGRSMGTSACFATLFAGFSIGDCWRADGLLVLVVGSVEVCVVMLATHGHWWRAGSSEFDDLHHARRYCQSSKEVSNLAPSKWWCRTLTE